MPLPTPQPLESDLAAQPTTKHYDPQEPQPQLQADPTLVTKVMALCSEPLPGSREVYRDRSGSIHLIVGAANEPLYLQVLHRGMCTLAPLSECLQGRVEVWLESLVAGQVTQEVPRETIYTDKPEFEPESAPVPPLDPEPAPEGETPEDKRRRMKREQMRRYRARRRESAGD